MPWQCLDFFVQWVHLSQYVPQADVLISCSTFGRLSTGRWISNPLFRGLLDEDNSHAAPGRWSLCEKLSLITKFPVFSGTRTFIIMFTRTCHLILPWASSVHLISHVFHKLRFNIIFREVLILKFLRLLHVLNGMQRPNYDSPRCADFCIVCLMSWCRWCAASLLLEDSVHLASCTPNLNAALVVWGQVFLRTKHEIKWNSCLFMSVNSSLTVQRALSFYIPVTSSAARTKPSFSLESAWSVFLVSTWECFQNMLSLI